MGEEREKRNVDGAAHGRCRHFRWGGVYITGFGPTDTFYLNAANGPWSPGVLNLPPHAIPAGVFSSFRFPAAGGFRLAAG
jgi:hypothetical protein